MAGNLYARLFPERPILCAKEERVGKKAKSAKKQTANISAGKSVESKPSAAVDSDGLTYSFGCSLRRALEAAAQTPFEGLGPARSLLRQFGRGRHPASMFSRRAVLAGRFSA